MKRRDKHDVILWDTMISTYIEHGGDIGACEGFFAITPCRNYLMPYDCNCACIGSWLHRLLRVSSRGSCLRMFSITLCYHNIFMMMLEVEKMLVGCKKVLKRMCTGKSPSFSLVEVNMQVFELCSSYARHARSMNIYEILKSLLDILIFVVFESKLDELYVVGTRKCPLLSYWNLIV